jgi:hypothetical protein
MSDIYDQQSDNNRPSSQRGCIILLALLVVFWVLILGTCYKTLYGN